MRTYMHTLCEKKKKEKRETREAATLSSSQSRLYKPADTERRKRARARARYLPTYPSILVRKFSLAVQSLSSECD